MSRTRPDRTRHAALALVVVLAAAACGGAATNDTAPVAEDGSGVAEDAAPETFDAFLASIASEGLGSEARAALLAERAVEEGAVVLYGGGGDPEQYEALEVGFEAAYPGIDLQWLLIEPGEFEARVTAERTADRGLYDVVLTSATVTSRLIDPGFVAVHAGVIVPDDFPADYVDDHTVGVTFNPTVVPVATSRSSLEDAPGTFDDYLAPEHAGCVLPETPSWVVGLVAELGADGAEAWFQGFLANDGIMASSGSSELQRLVAGDIDCLVHAQASDVLKLADAGAPIDFVLLERAPATVTAVSLSSAPPHPHAAALLGLWLSGGDSARILLEVAGRIPVQAVGSLPFERLEAWRDPTSDEARRTLPVSSALARAHAATAADLLERYHAPNLIPG
jgi:ABC-type Fe3+ transport system substrate-binding protein